MAPFLNIAVSTDNSQLGGAILDLLRPVSGLRPVQWGATAFGSGEPSLWPSPDIIVLVDQEDKDETLARLAAMREHFGKAAFFIVSSHQDPQHIVNVMKAGGARIFPGAGR